jgi:NCAIR mutase (PurE)-related protein
MNRKHLKVILDKVAAGEISSAEALTLLGDFDGENMGYAVLDLQREMRRGFPEVIYGAGKTPEQILNIMERLAEKSDACVIATKCSRKSGFYLRENLPAVVYHEEASMAVWEKGTPEEEGNILIMCAGTSDLPVAEEAALTAHYLGNKISKLYDVGVAGLHRLLNAKEKLLAARVIIVAAGMEGALPSVVAGLVDKPLIAVPTSVGYGTAFKGVSALLSMLNSCSSGVMTVNIDNGFGAAYAASLINRMK